MWEIIVEMFGAGGRRKGPLMCLCIMRFKPPHVSALKATVSRPEETISLGQDRTNDHTLFKAARYLPTRYNQ